MLLHTTEAVEQPGGGQQQRVVLTAGGRHAGVFVKLWAGMYRSGDGAPELREYRPSRGREHRASVMYAGEDGEVCVELGYVGKEISVSKGNQPDKSKAGGWPASKISRDCTPLLEQSQPHR